MSDQGAEARAALVGECPTRLHEEDRLVLVPGVLAVRAWGLVWLVPTAALGLLASRGMPAETAAALGAGVGGFVRLVSGQALPPAVTGLVAQLLPVVAATALGLLLAMWRPGGVSPRAYAAAWLRHAAAPRLTLWRPGPDYAPPRRPSGGLADEGRGTAAREGEKELAWR